MARTREEAEELLVDALREYVTAGDLTDEDLETGAGEEARLRIAVDF